MYFPETPIKWVFWGGLIKVPNATRVHCITHLACAQLKHPELTDQMQPELHGGGSLPFEGAARRGGRVAGGPAHYSRPGGQRGSRRERRTWVSRNPGPGQAGTSRVRQGLPERRAEPGRVGLWHPLHICV